MNILDGKTLSKQILKEITSEVARYKLQGLPAPGLGIITSGQDPAGQVYVRSKLKKAAAAGFQTFHRHVETEEELLNTVTEFNEHSGIDGYIVQLPLPAGFRTDKVIEAVSPAKDADGFHPLNLGKIFYENPPVYPATPAGVIRLLQHYHISAEGKHVVIAGRSQIVGKPLAMMFLQKKAYANATVSVIHGRTSDPVSLIRQADIFISAVGKPKIWKKDHFKPGAVIIDVGINADEDGNLCGDVDFDEVKEVASYITPVPGGVGPMTVSMLLANTLQLYKLRHGIKSDEKGF